MTRLIDADAFAKKAYDVAYPIIHGWNDHERGLALSSIALLLDEMQPVDAVPVRHGKWIIEDGHVCCSECGEISKEYNWCPYCGARMDE